MTIYFSAKKSAKKAAKVSPIDSIRNSAGIKINNKKIKSPKIIKNIFGIGGEISYKNLKRNKRKYLTTTISIAVSVSVFIALSYFVNSAFSQSERDFHASEYNLALNAYSTNDEFIEKIRETGKLDNIKNYIMYTYKDISVNNPEYSDYYVELLRMNDDERKEPDNISLIGINKEQYKKYLAKLGLDYKKYKDRGILYDYTIVRTNVNKNDDIKDYYISKYAYKDKDSLNISTKSKQFNIEIHPTKEAPFGFKGVNSSIIFVSEEKFNQIYDEWDNLNVYYDSTNASKLQDDIETLLGNDDYSLNNSEESAKMMKNFFTLLAIFLYGFIIVISLIGITNIFNTITTNMELRKQEFAMLKSIGMTNREFNNMIKLESLFMGFKALLFGIPIGLGLSYIMYLALELKSAGLPFEVPFAAIILSIFVVYLLITLLMKYSMNKIDKQNTIETIRNENI